jgi:hypothetical protein
MRFQVPLSTTPIKDTINLGDTIILEANFSDSVLDIISGKYFKLTNLDFKTRIAILKVGNTDLSLPEQPGATALFNFINEIGAVTDLSQSFGGLKCEYVNGYYKAKIRVIPIQKGVFTLFFFSQWNGHNSQLDFIDLGRTESGGRKIANMTNVYFLVNDSQTNYELLKQNSKLGSVVSPNTENIRAETQSTYTFAVK